MAASPTERLSHLGLADAMTQLKWTNNNSQSILAFHLIKVPTDTRPLLQRALIKPAASENENFRFRVQQLKGHRDIPL
jgi:hypothetical protein